MEPIRIRYSFRFGRNMQEVFDLKLDPNTIELLDNIPETLPSWTNLDFYQCPNCPLSLQAQPHCPVAANLVCIVNRLDYLFSYNETHMVVTTKERMISQITTVQRAVGSLIGLIIAASGCPHTVFFKPMARFHLPLADGNETIYRAASMYLLAQYFLKKEGKSVDFELEGLKDIYQNIQLVNHTVAQRLRVASKTDSVLNALVELDIFAQTLSLVIEQSLVELRSLFSSYLTQNPNQ